jgi:spore coat polysaccharide biosynthesis protein SpsF
MGSRRLPGKSLLPVWGQMPLLELVLRRVLAARSLTEVVLVTSVSPQDDPLARLGEDIGTAVFRGDEHDVLGRFASALERHDADAVVRVCADNPFVDPRAIDALVAFFEGAQPCDYASNHTPRSGLEDGFGAEVLSAESLRRSAAQAQDACEREHVTQYLLRHPDEFAIAFVPAAGRSVRPAKLDIDTQEEYEQIRRLAAKLPAAEAPLWDRQTVIEAWAGQGTRRTTDAN